jgi:hypothetical protein
VESRRRTRPLSLTLFHQNQFFGHAGVQSDGIVKILLG